jgi:SpoVK/Ycf46/Vps4 family AAA+-type ATPase
MLDFHGLGKEFHHYEIQFGCKLYFNMLAYIYENDKVKQKAGHVSEEQSNFLSKVTAYDLPNLRLLNSHITKEYKGKTIHLISAYDILYSMGMIQQFIFICIDPKEGSTADILTFIESILEERKDVQINKKLFSYALKNGPSGPMWAMVKPIQIRDIKTVYLDNKIKNDVITDINMFLGREDFYRRTGVPFKRCYLFHGLPGTGKTSFAKALATYFNKNIAILQLKSAALDDFSLSNAMHNVPDNTVVLIEDLDTTFSGGIRENEDPRGMNNMNRVSFNGILDMLDGINSYDKQLIFITCNNTKAFDNIYMRSGRIDKMIQFGALTEGAAKDMLNNFCLNGDQEKINKISEIVPIKKIVPADLQSIIMENNFDLDKICTKFTKQTTDIKNQYQNLNTRNNDLFKNHYKGSYGYTEQGMYQ